MSPVIRCSSHMASSSKGDVQSLLSPASRMFSTFCSFLYDSIAVFITQPQSFASITSTSSAPKSLLLSFKSFTAFTRPALPLCESLSHFKLEALRGKSNRDFRGQAVKLTLHLEAAVSSRWVRSGQARRKAENEVLVSPLVPGSSTFLSFGQAFARLTRAASVRALASLLAP
jgi:hypothetical protein